MAAVPDIDPQLERTLTHGSLPPRRFAVSEIKVHTVWVPMRDGTRLATDVYIPRVVPAPVVVIRTPYDRSRDDRGFAGALLAYARRGYVVVSQDCRGTGDSEPDSWDYYVYEADDGYDCIEWVHRQDWCDGFIGSIGGSYAGQTQWCMALHPAMSTIVPSVSGLGIATNSAHLHMLVNAYAKTVGKGKGKFVISYSEMEHVMLDETLATGYFNEPLEPSLAEALLERYPDLRDRQPWDAQDVLWERYCAMRGAERAEFVKMAFGVEMVTIAEVESLSSLFGQRISHDRHTIPNADAGALSRLIQAPPLLRTGWYDWGLNDALATFEVLRRHGSPPVAKGTRILVTSHAHNAPGYREGWEQHPELLRVPNTMDQIGYTHRWYEVVRDSAIDGWPAMIYYLMGANEWRAASDWPLPNSKQVAFYLEEGGILARQPPGQRDASDRYTYDPCDPTPTVGGSIVSSVYAPGSVDVSSVQQRTDVLVYTSHVFEQNLDVVGPLRMILYASSSAPDTDFVARLSDVFPDGRAIQLQSGMLRARYRDLARAPKLLEPSRVFRFEIDMWATANRFKSGHRLRVDISSADFPHYDRNTNRGGEPGPPLKALQTIFRDAERPSHLLFWVLDEEGPR